MFIPFLTSVHVILTADFPVDQSDNTVLSSLVLFLCQDLTLTNRMSFIVSPFWLNTHPTKWGSY